VRYVGTSAQGKTIVNHAKAWEKVKLTLCVRVCCVPSSSSGNFALGKAVSSRENLELMFFLFFSGYFSL